MEKLIETQDLYTNFYTFEGVVKALNGVSVIINQGETYGLVGESGCGKSVSVRSMMRIVQAPGRITDGKVVLFFSEKDKKLGIDIVKRSETYMQSIRGNDISMIFQEASTSLNPVLSIGYQVGESFLFHRLPQMLEETLQQLETELSRVKFPLLILWKKIQRSLFARELRTIQNYRRDVAEIDRRLYILEDKTDELGSAERAALNRKRDRLRKKNLGVQIAKRFPFLRHYYRKLHKTIRRNVIELLTSLGIPNPGNVVDRYPHELSGGMQQRIVIAIALACHPILLIADEPTSNLDVTIQAQIIDLIKSLKQDIIASVLFITHDLGLVAEICDRVTVMYAGDTCETTSVKELFKTPLHPYSQALLNSVPKVEQEGKLETIPGVVPNLINPPSGCRFHPRCSHAMEICKTQKPPTTAFTEGHTVACHLYPEKDRYR